MTAPLRASGALVLLLLAVPAAAQIDDRLAIGGGYDLYTGLQFAEDPDFLAARNRADVQLVLRDDRGRIVLAPRLTFDALDENFRGELREAFADVFFRQADLRIGHQIIAWGRTDGAFITDLLAPLDLSEFLAQPFEDLRLGLTAAAGTLFLGDVDLAVVLIPHRPTSRIPLPGSPWFPVPRAIGGVPVVLVEHDSEDPTLHQSEVALRATWRGLPRTDVSVLWINGFNRIPAFEKSVVVRLQPLAATIELEPRYQRRQVLGLSFETLAADPFVIRGEGAFHTSFLFDQPIIIPETLADLTDPEFLDAVERGFLMARPFVEAAVGIERSVGMQTFGVQGIGRLVVDHDERVAADRFEPSMTGLWVGRFRRETVTTRLFGVYNIGRDFWLNPEASYNLADGLNLSVGAQVFGGAGPDRENLVALLREPAFRFSTFRDNSFGYLRLSYQF